MFSFTLILAVLASAFANTLPKASSLVKMEESNDCTFTYAVRLEDGTKINNIGNNQTAGKVGKKITDIAIKASSGGVSYRVHNVNGGWLPPVSGYDWDDDDNGYAGNHNPIDLVEVIGGSCLAYYRVSPVNSGFYDWQIDAETSGGQDGYAGSSGKAIDRFQLYGKTGDKPSYTPTVIRQADSKYNGVRVSGCLFCCACWIANLNNIDEFDECFAWAVDQNLVREWDSYVLTTGTILASKIAAHYGRGEKTGIDIEYSGSHYYVVDSSGREVFNSVYIGYR